MAENVGAFELNFIKDDPGYYLSGEQAWFSGVFTHFTISAIHSDPTKQPQHELQLAEVARTIPEAIDLEADGWQRAIFIAKLMRSDQSAIQKLADEKPGKSLEMIKTLAERQDGFQSRLFVIQPITGYLNGLGDLIGLPAEDIPHLVASVHDNDKRFLRRVPRDQEEYHYGEHFGERIKPDELPEATWQFISNMHKVLYNQAVEAIFSGELDEATAD